MATPTGLSFPSSHATSSFAAARAFGAAAAVAAALRSPRSAMGALAALPRRALPVRRRRRRRARHRAREPRAMKVGIVGMPNAGKSSLFNALTRAGAEAANYPFTTIEPNVAVVPVRDERLDAVARDGRRLERRPDTIDFHDIAGLVAGAHKGEGLGNQFLANIRETDALLHVVRCHGDENVIHPEGRVDPARDMETIETELVFADLEQAERRHARVVREARGGDKAAIAEEAWLRDVIAALQRGEPARTVPVPDAAPDALRNLLAADRQAGAVRRQRRRGRRRGAGRRRRPRRRRRRGRGRGLVADRGRADRARRRGGGGDARGARRRRDRARPRRARRVRAARPDRVLHRRRGQAGAELAHAPRADRLARRGRDPLRHPARLRARRGDRLGGAGRRRRLRAARAIAARCGSRAATT